MKRVLAIGAAMYCASALAQSDLPARFALPATAGLFDKIRAAPGFDLSKPATFGYFFNSPDPEKIRTVQNRLLLDGFSFVETHVDAKGRTWVQVAKSELHSPESLVERNRQLKALADEVGVQYDGWDITRNAAVGLTPRC